MVTADVDDKQKTEKERVRFGQYIRNNSPNILMMDAIRKSKLYYCC